MNRPASTYGSQATPNRSSRFEYIHVIQTEGRGIDVATASIAWAMVNRPWSWDFGPSNPEEAPAYLWQAWVANFRKYEPAPWLVGKRPPWSYRHQ